MRCYFALRSIAVAHSNADRERAKKSAFVTVKREHDANPRRGYRPYIHSAYIYFLCTSAGGEREELK